MLRILHRSKDLIDIYRSPPDMARSGPVQDKLHSQAASIETKTKTYIYCPAFHHMREAEIHSTTSNQRTARSPSIQYHFPAPLGGSTKQRLERKAYSKRADPFERRE
jgi:hypothetical protein